MKKTGIGPTMAVTLAFVLAILLAGCASTPSSKAATPLDQLSPYDYYDPLTDARCTFIFKGETWSQEVDGVPVYSGVFSYGETESVLEITRMYEAETRKWVGTKAKPPITLVYEPNPLTITIKR
ncbi:hypothetical protein [Treponema primitia]|uniref:hypothetical protein n=1 Tax=Treponema primitia TaxID=88058 RepID=UPI00025555A3|nr:hypothetical protein [Treponema primitia]